MMGDLFRAAFYFAGTLPVATAKILLLESERTMAPSSAPALEKRGYTVTIEHDTQAMVKRTQALSPDVVILDAASLKTSGARICRRIHEALNGTPILLIVDKKNVPDPNPGAKVVLTPPFTPRKLLNSVARLLPGDDSAALQVGPIKLHLAHTALPLQLAAERQRAEPSQAALSEDGARAGLPAGLAGE